MKLYDALITANMIPASVCCTKEEEQALSKVIEAATKFYAEQIPDNPLTLEQLKQMGGEPVWIVWFSGESNCGHWMLCNGLRKRKKQGREVIDFGNGILEFCDEYNKKWLAYARKPVSE